MIYEKEQTHAASRLVLARAIGYAGISGSSAKTLSALRKFGLLEGRGENMRISEDGLAILLAAPDSSERIDAIRKCAFSPELFAELRERYGETLPSDENLNFLLVRKGFSAKGADEVIKNYKETVQFVLENTPRSAQMLPSPEQYVEEDDRIEVSADSIRHQTVINPLELINVPDVPGASPQDVASEVLRYRISRNSHASVAFTGPVTKQAVEKLIKLLELSAEDYPDEVGED